MANQTRRAELAELLRQHPLTVRELAAAVGARVRDVADDLEHVRKSLGKGLSIEPAICVRCEFEFTQRRRMTTPSRCPECRSERIEGPWLRLR